MDERETEYRKHFGCGCKTVGEEGEADCKGAWEDWCVAWGASKREIKPMVLDVIDACNAILRRIEER